MLEGGESEDLIINTDSLSLTQRSKELRMTQSWDRRPSQKLMSIGHNLEVVDNKDSYP